MFDLSAVVKTLPVDQHKQMTIETFKRILNAESKLATREVNWRSKHSMHSIDHIKGIYSE